MVEKMDLHRVFYPVSSTAKVNGVKRKNSQTEKRRFQGHLHEEKGDSEEREKDPGEAGVRDSAEGAVKTEGLEKAGGAAEETSGSKDKKGGRIQGRFIDIHV